MEMIAPKTKITNLGMTLMIDSGRDGRFVSNELSKF